MSDAQTTLTLNRDALAQAMASLSRIVERRFPIPILSNVHLAPGAEGVILTATDLDIVASVSLPCEAQGQTPITVPAALLEDVVKKLPKEASLTLTWQADGSPVKLISGRSRFSLQALPAQDFPVLDYNGWTHHFSIAPAQLLYLLDSTAFAISKEETRYYLNGVYLHTIAGEAGEAPRLAAAATDGHRLATLHITAPEGAGDMPGLILPTKTVQEVRGLASKAMEKGADIEIALSAARIRFSTPAITLMSKVIDGTFPDYQRVIPRNNHIQARLDRAALAVAADRVSTISSEKGRAAKFTFEAGKLTLSSHSPDHGSAEEEMEVEYDHHTPITIGFNARYVLDALGTLEGETVLIKLGDAGSPAIFQKTETDALVIVLMPMRV